MATAGNGKSPRILPSMLHTGDGWLALLRALDDGELDTYARIASDQVTHECRLRWVQRGLVALALAVLAWAVHAMVDLGPGRWHVALLGLSGVMVYWPYRAAKSRRLWERHLKAARDEQARREHRPNEGRESERAWD